MSTKQVTIGDATLITADVLDGLATLEDESVQCVVASPPYWGLRDYGIDGMIGLEPTLDEWLERMVEVCREIRRVLRSDGTFWLNVGDAYAANRSYQVRDNKHCEVGNISGAVVPAGYKPKDLLMMPARLALALQADGWWLRSDIIWAKPNPMPESCTDRPTSSHEHVFLLTRSARYFYDADAVRERQLTPLNTKAHQSFGAPGGKAEHVYGAKVSGDKWEPSGHRNLRNVWTIATQPYPEAHFATFPDELPRKCIMAGTSERGCCPQCGAPWVRIVEAEYSPHWKGGHQGYKAVGNASGMVDLSGNARMQKHVTTLGWQPSCDCKHHPQDGPMVPYKPVPCTVLDPFGGSMTTGLVALQLGRRFIGIELNPDYIELGLKRIDQEARQVKLSF